MNSTELSRVCEHAKELASQDSLKIILIVKMVLSFLGTIRVIRLAKSKGLQWLANTNAKVLYTLHLFLCLFVSFGYGFCWLYDYLRLFTSKVESCEYTVDAQIAVIFRGVLSGGVFAQTFVMFGFAIERTYATLKPRNYDRMKSMKLGVFLALVSVAIPCVLVLLLVLPVPRGQAASFSLRNPSNEEIYQIILYGQVSLEVLTLIILFIAERRNKRRKVYAVDLAKKYQINENVRIIKTLMPCFVIHFVIHFSAYSLLASYPYIRTILPFHNTSEPVCYVIFLELVGQAQMYSVIMPWILIYQLKKFSVQNDQILYYRSIDEYFHELPKFW